MNRQTNNSITTADSADFAAKTTSWADRPFAPRRFPFFYGWVIVAFTTLGTIASIPGQTIGVGVFTDRLIPVLGLSREHLALAYMFGTVASSFLLPLVGSLTDRFGTRVMVVVSALGLALSLYLFSHADLIPTLASSFPLLLALTACAYLLLRFFGQGALTLVSRVTIAKWFNHRRGLATGISSIAIAFTFNASPRFLNALVLSLDWKNTYLVLAASCGLGMALLGWLFFRDNPEQCNLPMDGHLDPQHFKTGPSRIPDVTRQFTRQDALKTLCFWTYTVVLSWEALVLTAFAFHVTSIGREAGLDSSAAYRPFLAIGLLAAATAAFAGWLSDRIRLRWLLLTMILSQVLAGLGMLAFSSSPGRFALIAGMGIGNGLFGLLLTITWPRYFGRQHLGAITSVSTSTLVFASAVGPYLFSGLHSLTGSYHTILLLSTLLPLAFLLPAYKSQNPQRNLSE